MCFMFVDESGDAGLSRQCSQFYMLTGLVVHETRYHAVCQALADFRQSLSKRYGFPFSQELHAAEFASKPRGKLAAILPFQRLRLLRDVLDFEAGIPDLRVLSVVVTKDDKPIGYDVHEAAWSHLILRYHNTIFYSNFPHVGPTDHGQVIIDGPNYYRKLRLLMLRMRQTNTIWLKKDKRQGDVPTARVIDDPVVRDSSESRFLQLADVNTWWLWQMSKPCHHIRTLGGRYNFRRLASICCKEACRDDPLGTVNL